MVLGLLGFLGVQAQMPHLHEYTYPVVTEENRQVRRRISELKEKGNRES